MVKVITNSHCYKCEFVKMWLLGHGVEFEELDKDKVSLSDLDGFKKMGIMSYPILVDGDRVSGGVDVSFLESLR